jgi:hypothetical protein
MKVFPCLPRGFGGFPSAITLSLYSSSELIISIGA